VAPGKQGPADYARLYTTYLHACRHQAGQIPVEQHSVGIPKQKPNFLNIILLVSNASIHSTLSIEQFSLAIAGYSGGQMRFS